LALFWRYLSDKAFPSAQTISMYGYELQGPVNAGTTYLMMHIMFCV
jgi:hypothetical protein